MKLSSYLTISIVSHGHEILIENLIQELDAMISLEGVNVIVTLNKVNELFSYENIIPIRLKLTVVRNFLPLGFGANHNRAFQKCETPWFAILNPDLSLPDDIFLKMINAAYVHKASLTSPIVINSDGMREDSIRQNLTPLSIIKRCLKLSNETSLASEEFLWYAGMFYIVNSFDYNELGGFDEKFFLYCEDYDLCARMYLAGKTLLLQPNVMVIHNARRSSRKSAVFFLLHLTSLFRVWISSHVWRIAFFDFSKNGRRKNIH
jgi:N-acetylglucosaminyl-diphospho-decaprenol L-rhamnosyltransferase